MRVARITIDLQLTDLSEEHREVLAEMHGIPVDKLDDVRGVTDDDLTTLLEDGIPKANLFDLVESEMVANIETVTVKTVEWINT